MNNTKKINSQFKDVATTACLSWSPRPGNEPDEKDLGNLQRQTEKHYLQLWENVTSVVTEEPKPILFY